MCAECGKKLPYTPVSQLKPYHCSRKCYSKYLWRCIKKYGLLR